MGSKKKQIHRFYGNFDLLSFLSGPLPKSSLVSSRKINGAYGSAAWDEGPREGGGAQILRY